MTMLVMLAAVVAWGLLVRADVPGYMARGNTPLRFPMAWSWLAQVVVMALATLVAAIALIRAYRSPRGPAGAVAPVAA